MQKTEDEQNREFIGSLRNLSQFSGFNDTTYDPNQMETDEVNTAMPNSEPVAMDEEELVDVGVLVVDTNFFIDDRQFFCNVIDLGVAFNLLVIVPFVVLQELDKLKHSKTLPPKEKRELCLSMQQLHRYIAEGHRGIRGQRREQILREEAVEDDQILDCCLYFQKHFPYTLVTLLTRDRLLITKALVHDIYHVDVQGMSPRDFLMHLATKASGQEPSFTAPESFKKTQPLKPEPTKAMSEDGSFPNTLKLGHDTSRSIHSKYGFVQYPSRNQKDKPKGTGLGASIHSHSTQWVLPRTRSETLIIYKAGAMQLPPENPNKPLSAKQAGLHKLITEIMNYAENELSLLLLKFFQLESPQNPEPWVDSIKTNPPWTLHQITNLITTAPKLSAQFAQPTLASFTKLPPLIKTYYRLHEYGFEMFFPDVNALMRHILNLFALFEKFDTPDVLNVRYNTVKGWLDVHKQLESLI
ncbi:hypothetical protein DSO57_1004999 [Entomophthora muscae]|uniref:Uncharacterized protein n=1 Tax=Entomophthora muscae TaxID=34485 RepID=A0ACC2SWZ7_9FUNG|nr:hypothetical protein DSO57_1004999 [Entomophthora muscae]